MSACGGVAAAQSLPAPPSAKIVSSVVLARLPGGFNERLAVVARAGLQSVELLGDEHGRWTDTDLAGIRRSLRSYNLTVDLIGPEPASAAPAQFMTELSRQLALARKLEAPMLLIAPGEMASAVENCRRAGDLAARSNITVLIAPAAGAARLTKEVDHEHVRLLFDVYDEHDRTGNVVEALESAGPLVKVFHVADAPDRRAPGSGSIPFDAFYKAVAKLGFEGHIAMAYRPAGDAAASLIRAVDDMRRSLASPPAKA